MSSKERRIQKKESKKRKRQVYRYREQTACDNYKQCIVYHNNNGDERRYRKRHYFASFTKGLPHNDQGLVDDCAFKSLLRALNKKSQKAFDEIIMAPTATRKLVNPQASFGMDLECSDTYSMYMKPPPRFDSVELAGEYVEDVWMALTRDISYTDYTYNNPLIKEACDELSKLTHFHGAKDDNNKVTPALLFRTNIPGVTVGPYISQFFYLACPFGAGSINQKITVPVPDINFMTTWSEWLSVQRGETPTSQLEFLPEPRYIINGRDLGQFVHIDVLYQAYFQAMLILFNLQVPFKKTNPYYDNVTQDGFGTLGGPNIAALLPEVCTRALKCVWFQKWGVHRLLRPEVFGGRLNANLTSGKDIYPINVEAQTSVAVQKVFEKYGSYLLPMAYPEGSPVHPSYGAGHATVAGACTTLLKAWFQEDYVLQNPVIPTIDGHSLEPYVASIGEEQLTVGGELNKIAHNVAFGRNIAGVHWRSDGYESLKLGEQVAMSILKEQKKGYNEKFPGWTFTSFEGHVVHI